MIEALLVVLSNPVAGRDEDFNDWYTHVHTRDAVGFRGCLAQQRFVLADNQPSRAIPWRYLALYETYDAHRFGQEHIDNMNTPRMVIEDSFDASRINDFFYFPLHFRDNAPRRAASGSVVMEQMNALPGREADFRDWYENHYLPAKLNVPGVLSGTLLGYEADGQMLNYAPDHRFVALYRLSDDGARAAWQDDEPGRQDSLDRKSLAVSFWDILTPRITEDEIYHPTAAGLAAEEAARARIARQGTRVVNDGHVLRD